MTKKVPLRQCLGCRTMYPKSQLLRVAKSAQGEISLDCTGKKPGRGAYLCLEEPCFKRIQKSRALERVLSSPITPEIYQELAECIHSTKIDNQNRKEQEVKEDVSTQ